MHTHTDCTSVHKYTFKPKGTIGISNHFSIFYLLIMHIYKLIYLFNNLFIHLCINSCIHVFVHLLICLFIYLFIFLAINSFTNLFIYSLIHLFTNLFIYLLLTLPLSSRSSFPSRPATSRRPEEEGRGADADTAGLGRRRTSSEEETEAKEA